MTEVRLSGTGGVVAAVQEGSLADAAAIRPSDRLIAINGQPLRDVIDYQFYSSDDRVTLELERDGRALTVEIQNDAGEPLGIEFEDPTFDRLRTCNNNCPFCFLKGLPRGLRRTLYLKDDDYRYSFLFGNFVTLTNLSEGDWDRVVAQQLSPLYVSVHATEPEVRRALLGNPRAPEIVPQIDALARAGIEIHTQVVLCPGQNDGVHLDRTIQALGSRFPTVQSIGVVPVGLTPRQTEITSGSGRKATIRVDGPLAASMAGSEGAAELQRLRTTTHCERVVPGAVRLYEDDEAAEVVAQVETWQRRFRREIGRTLVYLADEFYLMAGVRVPSARYYDGYPQYENGIGMVRSLLDEWHRARRKVAVLASPRPQLRAALVCGELSATILRQMVDELSADGFDLTLIPVKNEFFGESVTVSGLLTGADVLPALASSAFDVVFLPRYMLDARGVRTLDGWTPEELRAQLGSRLVFTTSPREVVAVLSGTERHRPD